MKKEGANLRSLNRFLILLSVFFIFSGCSRNIAEPIREAQSRFMSGNYEGAKEAYARFAEDHPKSRQAPEAFFWAGQISYLYLKEPRKALDYFHRVLTDYPASEYVLPSRSYLAEMYEKEFNEPRLAVQEYQKLIDATPEHAREDEYLYRIGEIFFNQGDLVQSKNEWEEVVRKYPSGKWGDKASFHLAMILVIRTKCEEGIKALEAFIKEYSKSDLVVEAKYERGACLEELGLYDEALEALKGVLPEYRNKPVVENRIRKTEEKKAKAARSLNSISPKAPASRPQE